MTPVGALPQAVDFLIRAGHCAPSADNLQPWRFEWVGSRLRLLYRVERGSNRVFPAAGHCANLTMGAVIENILQAASAAGMATDDVSFGSGALYLDMGVDADAPIAGEAGAAALFGRFTNRLAYLPRAIPDKLLATLRDLREDGCRLLVFTGTAEIRQIAGLIRLASELRFRNRVVHEWFSDVLRMSAAEAECGTGLDVATLGLPPGGTILLRVIRDWGRLSVLNRAGMYKLLAAVEASKISASPALVAVVGPAGRMPEVAAGRLMERAWILLNDNGVSVQPAYVVSDALQRLERGELPPTLNEPAHRLRRQTRDALGCGESLHMLLRTGYPAAAPVRSKRRPLEAVVTGGG